LLSLNDQQDFDAAQLTKCMDKILKVAEKRHEELEQEQEAKDRAGDSRSSKKRRTQDEQAESFKSTPVVFADHAR
jgi:hypothetical protein